MKMRRTSAPLAILLAVASALAVGLAVPGTAAAAPTISAIHSIVSNDDGRIELFASDGTVIWHRWQRNPNGSQGWSGWDSLGSPGSAPGLPAAVVNFDGRVEVFAVGGGRLRHAWQQSTGGWSGWATLGTRTNLTNGTSMTAVVNDDGRPEVFIAQGCEVFHLWRRSDGSWSDWDGVYRPTWDCLSEVDVQSNVDGRLEVFATGTTGAVYHAWQRVQGGWSGWDGLVADFPGIENVQIAQNWDGRLELFGSYTNETTGYYPLVHMWQRPEGGWSGLTNLGGYTVGGLPVGFPAYTGVGQNAGGRLEHFAWREGRIHHMWQQASGGWSGQIPLAPFTTLFPPLLKVASNDDGRLEVFIVNNGTIYHIWQLTDGGWSPDFVVL